MRNKRITSPNHVRQVLSEQINRLRNDKVTSDDIDKARAIGYLSNVALTAIRDGELEQRIKALEEKLKEKGSETNGK